MVNGTRLVRTGYVVRALVIGLVLGLVGSTVLGAQSQANQVLRGYNGRFYPGFVLGAHHLVGLTLEELRILKEEVYARYGRPITDANLRTRFTKTTWYRANAAYRDTMLNEQDTDAIALIDAFLIDNPDDVAYFKSLVKAYTFKDAMGYSQITLLDAKSLSWVRLSEPDYDNPYGGYDDPYTGMYDDPYMGMYDDPYMSGGDGPISVMPDYLRDTERMSWVVADGSVYARSSRGDVYFLMLDASAKEFIGFYELYNADWGPDELPSEARTPGVTYRLWAPNSSTWKSFP